MKQQIQYTDHVTGSTNEITEHLKRWVDWFNDKHNKEAKYTIELTINGEIKK